MCLPTRHTKSNGNDKTSTSTSELFKIVKKQQSMLRKMKAMRDEHNEKMMLSQQQFMEKMKAMQATQPSVRVDDVLRGSYKRRSGGVYQAGIYAGVLVRVVEVQKHMRTNGFSMLLRVVPVEYHKQQDVSDWILESAFHKEMNLTKLYYCYRCIVNLCYPCTRSLSIIHTLCATDSKVRPLLFCDIIRFTKPVRDGTNWDDGQVVVMDNWMNAERPRVAEIDHFTISDLLFDTKKLKFPNWATYLLQLPFYRLWACWICDGHDNVKLDMTHIKGLHQILTVIDSFCSSFSSSNCSATIPP